MKCALLQLDFSVGDIAGNTAALYRAAQRAFTAGARLCAAPELCLIGAPPRDLLLYDAVLQDAEAALCGLARDLAQGPALVLGTAVRSSSGGAAVRAVLLHRGEIRTLCERRPVDFEHDAPVPPSAPGTAEVEGLRLAATLCGADPEAGMPAEAVPADIDVLLCLACAPFRRGRTALRETALAALAGKSRTHVLYVNQVGGNDELIFDGRSLHVAPDGVAAARAPAFEEDVLVADTGAVPAALPAPDPDPDEDVRRALILGIRDYMAKTGLRRAVLGLSGGVDSALTAVLACEAAGPENVTGLIMPSPWSSNHSVSDALELARNLGCTTFTVPIEPAMNAFTDLLAPQFAGLPADVSEENLQARIRGTLLMAHANKFGAVLLNTSNRSELAVGYCTLYGDMCGALAVLADLSKTDVYRLCRHINAVRGGVIPEHTLSKPPSAELRPGQTDQDSLPPYNVLDPLLELMLDRRLSLKELCAAGYDETVIRDVAGLVARAEFKRRQAPPVLRVTDRRNGARLMPLAGPRFCR